MSNFPQEKNVDDTKVQSPLENELIAFDKINQIFDEKRHSKEEIKEGLNVENSGAFKEDVIVGERSNMRIKKRKEYSKYDFIKVRVTLGEHFYVLSRFLVSRMLTLCKVIKNLKSLIKMIRFLILMQSKFPKI